MENTFQLKIISCNRVFYEGECQMLIFPGTDGEIGIMAHHEAMICGVETGELRYRLPGGDWEYAIVADGMLKVENNRVDIIVFSAEHPEEVDEARAQAALERAREQLQHRHSLIEYKINQAAMVRAMARLRRKNNDKVIE